MNTGLEDRVAVVTGAGSGIGRATAAALLDEGCTVVGADLNLDALLALEAELGPRFVPVEADVSTESGARRPIEQAASRFDRLDVLVLAAGILESNRLPTLGATEWDRVQGVNVRAAFLAAQAAVPVMARGSWGRIIALSSVAAFNGGIAAGPAYVTSKAALMGLTKWLAMYAGKDGITANCINPGVIETPMTAVMDDDYHAAAAARSPLGRNGRADEVAAAIVFLASTSAGFITGTHISVNGGLHLD